MEDDEDEFDALIRSLDDYSKITGFLPASGGKYVLQGHEPIECRDLILWATWMEDSHKDRIVQQDQIGDYWISTVFLGLDHNFLRPPPPILFETMVFVGPPRQRESDGCERYSTWDEAVEGHRQVCERIRTHG